MHSADLQYLHVDGPLIALLVYLIGTKNLQLSLTLLYILFSISFFCFPILFLRLVTYLLLWHSLGIKKLLFAVAAHLASTTIPSFPGPGIYSSLSSSSVSWNAYSKEEKQLLSETSQCSPKLLTTCSGLATVEIPENLKLLGPIYFFQGSPIYYEGNGELLLA